MFCKAGSLFFLARHGFVDTVKRLAVTDFIPYMLHPYEALSELGFDLDSACFYFRVLLNFMRIIHRAGPGIRWLSRCQWCLSWCWPTVTMKPWMLVPGRALQQWRLMVLSQSRKLKGKSNVLGLQLECSWWWWLHHVASNGTHQTDNLVSEEGSCHYHSQHSV